MGEEQRSVSSDDFAEDGVADSGCCAQGVLGEVAGDHLHPGPEDNVVLDFRGGEFDLFVTCVRWVPVGFCVLAELVVGVGPLAGRA